MGAWGGEHAARMQAFAERHGHQHIWSWLAAHPKASFEDVADEIGDVAAVHVEAVALAWCREHRQMGPYLRGLFVRAIGRYLPRGWSHGSGEDRVQAVVSVGSSLREPYDKLCARIAEGLLADHPPPADWAPQSEADPVLEEAWERALVSLSTEERRLFARGAVKPEPGDAYWSLIARAFDEVNIHDGGAAFERQFRALSPLVGHLLATHWCQSEICNGGFHQFFGNPTGVLAPEAAAGFDALGMPRCAALVVKAISVFGARYPREQEERRAFLDAQPGETREDWDPFYALDDQLYALLASEAGGYSAAADRAAAAAGG